MRFNRAATLDNAALDLSVLSQHQRDAVTVSYPAVLSISKPGLKPSKKDGFDHGGIHYVRAAVSASRS